MSNGQCHPNGARQAVATTGQRTGLLLHIVWILPAVHTEPISTVYLTWPSKRSGNSYTQTGFSTTGEQPSASNPMGNPALGKFLCFPNFCFIQVNMYGL